MKNRRIMIFFLVFSLVPTICFSQNFSDYLILQDIGPYKLEAPQKVVGGYIGGPRVFGGAGVIAPTGHFYPDHSDKTYEVYYEGGSTLPSPTVQVTQHSGSDSDKWLLHEVEDGYRDGDDSDGRLGRLSGAGVKIRDIGGNKFFYWGLGGGSYSWISSLKVIEIKYTDLQRTKPEPIEVVQAYLQKHPSTIALTDADLKNKSHDEQWIKDEMDRRLWLCDKWDAQFQAGKVSQADLLKELVDHMNVFLDYRQKYYGISATEDKKALANFLYQNDITSIKNKLNEYKTWWSANKSSSLIGILSVYAHRAYNHVSNFFRKLLSFLTSLWERLIEIFG